MRKLLIVIGILIVMVLGFWFLSNMTGNVITGASSGVVVNEYFRIDNTGASGEDKTNETEDLNGTQNSSR